MSRKIDVRSIISNHFSTIVNANTNKTDLIDWFVFLVLPIAISFLLVKNGVYLDGSLVEILVGALSIFVGLLFSLLLFIFEIIKKKGIIVAKKELAKEIIHNIAFSILNALIGNIFLLLAISNYSFEIITLAFNFIADFVLIEFVVVLLMILKRMYNLILDEIREIENED